MIRAGTDDHLLERPKKTMDVRKVPIEVQDRVTNKLTRPMVRYVATAVDVNQLSSTRFQKLRRCQYVRDAAILSEGEYVRMLDEQQNMWWRLWLGRSLRSDQASLHPCLKLPRRSVRHVPQVAEYDRLF